MEEEEGLEVVEEGLGEGWLEEGDSEEEGLTPVPKSLYV